MSPAGELAGRLGAKRVGREWRTLCPLHADANPSLDFRDGESGVIVFTCRVGCDSEALAAHFTRSGAIGARGGSPGGGNGSAGASQAPIRTLRYEVKDLEGWLVATHLRHEYADGRKSMPWEVKGASGLGGLKTEDLPLYGAERLVGQRDRPVIVTEGEKAAQSLIDRGAVAVGTVTGAGGAPGPEALEILRGRTVVLWPDNDGPGREHMRRIGERLGGIALQVEYVDWREGGQGCDAADYTADLDARLPLVSMPPGELPRKEATIPSKTEPSKEGFDPSRVITFEALEAMGPALEDVAYVVKNLIPDLGMVGFLVGQPKAGKSTLGLSLVGAVGRGDPDFLGLEVTKKKVLYLSLEDPQEYLAWMVYRHAAGVKDSVAYASPLILNEATLEELAQYVKAEGIGLVYIATFLAGAWTLVKDENDNRGVAAVVLTIKEFARRTGVPVLIEAHSAKAEDRAADADPIRSMRGASAAAAHADFIIAYKNIGDDGFTTKRVLSARGRFVSVDPLRLDWSRETGQYTVLGQDVQSEMAAADFKTLMERFPRGVILKGQDITDGMADLWAGSKWTRRRRLAAAVFGRGVAEQKTPQGHRFYTLPATDDWA